MALWFGRSPRRESQAAVLTVDDVLAKYDLLDVVNEPGMQFAVVAERRGDVISTELGSSSPSPFTSWTRGEYNPDLRELKGLQKFDQMRRSDGTVRGTLRLVKTPVLAARWFVEHASDSAQDKAKADFVWRCLTREMSISFSQLLTEALLMMDYGYYMFEKVFELRTIEGKERMVWKKLAPRHPMDVKEWILDAHGGPRAVVMYAPEPRFMDDIVIPIEKLLVFTFDKEGGDMTGVSVLRSAYKHWYYKEQLYKIDAIQKERHGIGIPVIKLPVGYTKDDRNAADNLGRNLRTNERAHVVLPPNWELLFAKLEGHPVDALKSIEHHDGQIEKNVLGSFIEGDATKEEDQVMFLKATRFIADVIADTFNQYAIPQLVGYNFAHTDLYPRLRARRIGESADWRTLSFAVRNLIGAKAMRPDDKLEEFLREEMDMPKADPSTVREAATPQAGIGGGEAGPPRQPKPSATPPRGNGGTDQSGG